MKKSIKFLFAVLTASAIVMTGTTTSVMARSFRSGSSAPAGNTSDIITNRFVGMLGKVSVKGDNAGLFSSAEKSVEASIYDVGGEKFSFSASMRMYQSLTELAGQQVIVETGENRGSIKIGDAKTKNILVKISPVTDRDLDEEIICGPENPTSINYGFKPYSVGYRVVRVVGTTSTGNGGWRLTAYVGTVDDEKWDTRDKNKIPEVTFTGQCAQNASITKMLYATGRTVIMDYAQKKDGGMYHIGRVAIFD